MEIKLNQIICGKSEEKLKEFPDNFFDGIITDPPYEINFMGKDWDASGIAYNVELWKEVLRVAKLGAHLLCFGGTRTHHRIACAIEDAGWKIRDCMMWIHGEGFPKSTNISKQLDKEAATNLAQQWDGYGTGLKPAWEPIIIAMKPLEQGLTYAQNAEKWNVAGLNIDSGRIGTDIIKQHLAKRIDGGSGIGGKGTGIPQKATGEITQTIGRWPANLILSHSSDCVFVGTKNEQEVWACIPDCPIRIMDNQSGINRGAHGGDDCGYNWVNGGNLHKEIKSDCNGGASRFFYCAKAKRNERENGCKDFIECAKCGKFDSDYHCIEVDEKKIKERCIRNNHPTVKPLDLIRYLCNLIKMPSVKENKQVILDPFCGSGSTLVAAEQFGINYIGIDQSMDNVIISTARIGA